MRAPYQKPEVKLVGEDGNAYSIMGRTAKALRELGADEEYVNKYYEEAKAGDYEIGRASCRERV